MMKIAVLLAIPVLCLGIPKIPGSFMRIEIMKPNSANSYLRTFYFTEGDIVPLSGAAPFATKDGIQGELIPFNPLNGCEELAPSNYTKKLVDGSVTFRHSGKSVKTIAFISAEGNCSLAQKVINAQRVPDVVGVLVFLKAKDTVEKANGILKDQEVKIPGFIISHTLGRNLLEKINKYRAPGKDDDFVLPETPRRNSDYLPDPVDNAWIKVTLIHVDERTTVKGIVMMVLSIICVILLAAFIGSIIAHFQTWRSSRSNADNGNFESLPSINKDFISKLPKIKYNQVKENRDADKEKAPIEEGQPTLWMNQSCPICLDEYKEGEDGLVQLPCGHLYHPSCITPWLLNRSTCCPMCKIDVRVGSQNALLIQMGKPPVLPQSQNLFTRICDRLSNCCRSD